VAAGHGKSAQASGLERFIRIPEAGLLELDHFDRALLGRLGDLVLVGGEIDTWLDEAGVIGDLENLGAGIFAEVANGASLFNPNFRDCHCAVLLKRMCLNGSISMLRSGFRRRRREITGYDKNPPPG
jgi:hypothetical protein